MTPIQLQQLRDCHCALADAPRRPTAVELEVIHAAVMQRTGINADDAFNDLLGARIAVFDRYCPDGPGYTGKVALVIWSGGANILSCFGFRDSAFNMDVEAI